jgi:hypothetical protein
LLNQRHKKPLILIKNTEIQEITLLLKKAACVPVLLEFPSIIPEKIIIKPDRVV